MVKVTPPQTTTNLPYFHKLINIENKGVVFICVPNIPSEIEKILSKIVLMGFNVQIQGGNDKLYAKTNTSTTVMCFSIGEASDLSKVCSDINKAIKDFTHYGIVIFNTEGKSICFPGNVKSDTHSSGRVSQVTDEEFKKLAVKVRNTPHEHVRSYGVLGKNPEQLSGGENKDQNWIEKSDLDLLKMIVEKSCSISDVFFDNSSKEDRVKLLKILNVSYQKDLK